ncbi:hypothetical protein XENTR_v10004493 [Xenopus tropicalis]|nr:hypothetical protein XENTR_v10004493 [Xenopus tropicalis]
MCASWLRCIIRCPAKEPSDGKEGFCYLCAYPGGFGYEGPLSVPRSGFCRSLEPCGPCYGSMRPTPLSGRSQPTLTANSCTQSRVPSPLSLLFHAYSVNYT